MVFRDDDEIGRDLAMVDWTATPAGGAAGAVAAEPPHGGQHPVGVPVSHVDGVGGPDLTFFCNAAYRRDTLGSKYPLGTRPARERSVGGDLARHRTADRIGSLDR